MRALPAVLTEELQKEFNSFGHLIIMTLSDPVSHADVPLYYTDKDMDVVYDDGSGAKTYLSRGIEFNGGQQSITPKVDHITFEIDNTSLEFSAYVQNYETRGKECVIYRAAFDNYLKVIGMAPVFIGILDRVDIDQQRMKVDVLNSFIRWSMTTPRRRHYPGCPWTFKSTECGYTTGPYTSCDKVWDSCVARSRIVSFGGFRWIQSLSTGDIKIVWGRSA